MIVDAVLNLFRSLAKLFVEPFRHLAKSYDGLFSRFVGPFRGMAGPAFIFLVLMLDNLFDVNIYVFAIVLVPLCLVRQLIANEESELRIQDLKSPKDK